MFGNDSFRPMNGHPIRMGQETAVAVWWPSEGLASIQQWDALVQRASQIANEDARREILEWIGRSDIPGSPAERYETVATDIQNRITPATTADVEIVRARLDALNRYVSELDAKVRNAEQAYGLLSASPEAGSMSERSMMAECISGGIALLGLVIFPLVLE